MTRRRALLAALVGALTATIAVASCLPDYSFRDASSVSDGGPGDGTTGDASTDGASSDGPSGDAADAGAGDAATDGAVAFDASSSVLFAIPDGGTTFSFRIDKTGGGPQLTSAVLTHAFYIDRYEVTVRRFRSYFDSLPVPCATGTCSLDVGGPYQAQMQWLASWNVLRSNNINDATTSECSQGPASFGPLGTNSEVVSGNDGGSDYPITCINWFDAVAFCASEGKRLPTELEWQYAATSQGTNLSFPWTGSNDNTVLDCAHATVDVGRMQDSGGGCLFPRVVGSAPLGASTQGVFDLSGSVFEWVWDVGAPIPATIPTDYAGPALADAGATTPRVRRGGSFNSYPDESVVLNYGRRADFHASPTYNDMGFRCAKTAP
jgi:formylglycine-generating enzyme required for sulfatase activity